MKKKNKLRKKEVLDYLRKRSKGNTTYFYTILRNDTKVNKKKLNILNIMFRLSSLYNLPHLFTRKFCWKHFFMGGKLIVKT